LLVSHKDGYPDEGGGTEAEEYDTIEEIHTRMDDLLKEWGEKVSISVYPYFTRMDAVPKEVTTKLYLVATDD